MFKNPLEQFDVILFFTNFGYLKTLILISIFITFLYFRYQETDTLPTRKELKYFCIFFAIIHSPVSNFAIMTFSVLAIFSFFFKKQLRHRVPFFVKFIPFLFNQLFYFIKTTLKDNLSIRKKSFIFLMYFLFIFILLGNLFGMLPYSITITSHFIFTLYYALAFFIGINIIGILYQEENYFILFLPEGVPIWIIPILIIIEYLSYFARIFSLAIRLFANMMSGHVLMKILIGFAWNLVTLGYLWKAISIFPLLIIFSITGLELSIALLQSYVFIILLFIYLNDVINTH